MFLYLKKESLHLRSISLRLSSSPTVFLPGSSSPRRIDGLLFLSTMHERFSPLCESRSYFATARFVNAS
uniref:Uncharacterized protein n=1 Tax=Brassica oleracea var. oleracea TaxID=109376 RepID=A0A0D3BVI6_BRAOL